MQVVPHGQGEGDGVSDDPYLTNVIADMTAYILLEEAFCDCDGLCVCGWDDEVTA
jgi:hypothetical protein